LEADLPGQRSRGTQRKRWIDVVKYSMEDLWLDLGTWRIELSGDGKPVWLTPHPRDLNQPEGDRELCNVLTLSHSPLASESRD